MHIIGRLDFGWAFREGEENSPGSWEGSVARDLQVSHTSKGNGNRILVSKITELQGVGAISVNEGVTNGDVRAVNDLNADAVISVEDGRADETHARALNSNAIVATMFSSTDKVVGNESVHVFEEKRAEAMERLNILESGFGGAVVKLVNVVVVVNSVDAHVDEGPAVSVLDGGVVVDVSPLENKASVVTIPLINVIGEQGHGNIVPIDSGRKVNVHTNVVVHKKFGVGHLPKAGNVEIKTIARLIDSLLLGGEANGILTVGGEVAKVGVRENRSVSLWGTARTGGELGEEGPNKRQQEDEIGRAHV